MNQMITAEEMQTHLKQDPITGRAYYYFTSIEAIPLHLSKLIPHLDKFIIATLSGHARFLLEDGTLVITRSLDVEALYKHLTREPLKQDGTAAFYFAGAHAQVQLTCKNCDDGSSYRMFYDIDNKVERTQYPNLVGVGLVEYDYNCSHLKDEHAWTELVDRYHETCIRDTALIFYFTLVQSTAMLEGLKNLYSHSEAGEWKYVDFIHDCVSILDDSYKNAGFPHHYSLYFADHELLNSGEVVPREAFVRRFYYPENYLSPHRSIVHNFTASVLGAGFPCSWDNISEQAVDFSGVIEDDPIYSVVANITEYREKTYEETVKFCLNSFYSWGCLAEPVDVQKMKLVAKHLLLRPITYHALFYEYVEYHKRFTYDLAAKVVTNFSATLAGRVLIWGVCDHFLLDNDEGPVLLDPAIPEIIGQKVNVSSCFFSHLLHDVCMLGTESSMPVDETVKISGKIDEL